MSTVALSNSEPTKVEQVVSEIPPEHTESSPLPGANVLLIGGSGAGKTHSLCTLPKAGVTPFILFTEPGMDVAAEHMNHGDYHWCYSPPANVPWSVLIDKAKIINTLSFEAQKKYDDPNKSKYNQFVDALQCMNKFVCDECGENFGDVATWGTNRAFVVDSLSGLSTMSMQLTVGGKPSPHQGEWGTAMGNIEGLIQTLTNGTKCHFILLAHLDREVDEVSGGSNIYALTLGKKLAPKLPFNFTDVIQAKRTGTEWSWSTTEPGTDLKARNVAWSKGLPASFNPLIQKWQSRGGIICPTNQPTLQPQSAAQPS